MCVCVCMYVCMCGEQSTYITHIERKRGRERENVGLGIHGICRLLWIWHVNAYIRKYTCYTYTDIHACMHVHTQSLPLPRAREHFYYMKISAACDKDAFGRCTPNCYKMYLPQTSTSIPEVPTIFWPLLCNTAYTPSGMNNSPCRTAHDLLLTFYWSCWTAARCKSISHSRRSLWSAWSAVDHNDKCCHNPVSRI